MTSTSPILIAYDSSDDARHATDYAATLLTGIDAVVLYVRQPLEGMAARAEGHDELDASLVVPGSRGRRGLRSPVLGS